MAEIQYEFVLIKMSFPSKLSVIRITSRSTLACVLISACHGTWCVWISRLLASFGIRSQSAIIPKVLIYAELWLPHLLAFKSRQSPKFFPFL